MAVVSGIAPGTGLQTLGTPYTNFGDDPTDSGLSSSSLGSVFTSGINLGGVLYSSVYINNNGAVTFSHPTDRNGYGNFGGNNGYTVRAKGYSGDGVVSLGLLWADYITSSSTANGGSGSFSGTGFGTNTVYYGVNQDSDAIAYTWDDVVRYNGSGASDVNAQILLERVGISDVNISYIYESANYYYRNSLDGSDCAFGLNLSLGDENALWSFIDYVDLQDQDMVNNPGNTGIVGVFEFSIRDGYITTYATGTSDKPDVPEQTIAWGSNTANAANDQLLGYLDASDNAQVLSGRFVYSTGYKSLTSEDGYFHLNPSNGEVRFTSAGAAAFNALPVGGSLTSTAFIQVRDNENNVSVPGPVHLIAKLDNGVGPVLLKATTNFTGNKIILTYDEELASNAASLSDFIVSIGGCAVEISNVVVRSNTVELILTGSIKTGQSISVSYVDPSAENDSNAVQDSAGNDASSMVNTEVTNRVSPRDPQKKSKNYQLTDDDGDGLIELTTSKDGLIVDVNKDGTADSQQQDVVGIRLINSGSRNTDFGGIEVPSPYHSVAAYLYTPNTRRYISVIDRAGQAVRVSFPHKQQNAFAGAFLFSIDGLASGGSTQVTLHLPAGIRNEPSSYSMFNYTTNCYEEYLDSSNNPLYEFVDLDKNGAIDAVVLDILDGSQEWDRDGLANGTFLCLGYAAYANKRPRLHDRLDAVTGQKLEEDHGFNHLESNRPPRELVAGDILNPQNSVIPGIHEAADLITSASTDRISSFFSFERSMLVSSDRIDYSEQERFNYQVLDADTTQPGRQSLRFLASQAFSGVPGELRATQSHLQADVNGNGVAEISAVLAGSIPMLASSLLL